MKRRLLFTLIAFVLIQCSSESKLPINKSYLRWVGDTEVDDKTDDPSFKLCSQEDKIKQYFHIGEGPMYKGEKPHLVRFFKDNFETLPGHNQDGLIRVRFVVNCEGKAGRFRLLQSDFEYNEITFDKKITSQLIQITSEVEKWQKVFLGEDGVDYYTYLIFKINDGQITEILP